MCTRYIAATAIAGALGLSTANAQVSDDLAFCAKLKNGRERLACYDAAARLEKRDTQTAPSNRVRPVTKSELPSDPVPVTVIAERPAATSSFDGFYAAVLAGYGFSSGNAAPFSFSFPNVQPFELSGAYIGGAFGFNTTSGNLLIGIEGRARYDSAQRSESTFNQFGFSNSLPLFVSSGSGGDPREQPFPDRDTIPISFSQKNTTTLTRPFAGDLSFRAGMIWQDWLLYGRVGAGIEHTRTMHIDDQSASKTCVGPTIIREIPSANSWRFVAVDCASIASGRVTTRTFEQFSPYVTLGMGVEANFGAFFARAEAELISHFMQPPGSPVAGPVYYTTQVSGALGYRF